MVMRFIQCGVRFSLLGVALTVAACQPASPVSASRVLATVTVPLAPAPVVAAATQEPEAATPGPAVKSLEWKSVPCTRLAVNESIWVETNVTPTDALFLTVGNALNTLGGSCNPTALIPAALPKQPAVAW